MAFLKFSRLKFYVSFLFGCGLLFILYKFTKLDLHELQDTLLSISPIYICCILGLTWLFAFSVSLRWGYLVKMFAEEERFPRGFFFHYYCLSIVATHQIPQLLGNLGVKTVSLKCTHDISLLKGTYVVLLEHIYNILIIAVMSLPSLLYVCDLLSEEMALGLTVVLLCSVLVMVKRHYSVSINCIFFLLQKLQSLLARNSFFKEKMTVDLVVFKESCFERKDQVVALYLFSLFVYCSVICRYYIYAGALQVEIPFLPFLLCFPIVYVAGALGFTPGALGIAEFGWLGVLILIGVDKETAAIYVIGQRLLNVLSIVVVFLVGWLFYGFNIKLQSQIERLGKSKG